MAKLIGLPRKLGSIGRIEAAAALDAGSLEGFSPLAKLANIPAENSTEFLFSVFQAERNFKAMSAGDGVGRKFNTAVRAVETAANGLLRSLEYLDDKAGGYLESGFIQRLQDDPETRWSRSQWAAYWQGPIKTKLRES